MPIRWSARAVSEAMDKAEELINQAREPLEQAKTVAEEARRIANLPGYIDDKLVRLISEIERAIGGGRWETTGRLRGAIDSLRKDIPEGAIEADHRPQRMF